MLYLIDANVVITAKDSYYAIDQVPEFWDWLVHHGAAGNIKIPRENWDEVSPGANEEDAFHRWRRDRAVADAIVLSEEVDMDVVQNVISEGYGINPSEDDLGKMAADPFLIAYALSGEGRCVVTTEVSKPNRQGANRHIPDVCAMLGVSCYNTFDLMRFLRFSTSWQP